MKFVVTTYRASGWQSVGNETTSTHQSGHKTTIIEAENSRDALIKMWGSELPLYTDYHNGFFVIRDDYAILEDRPSKRGIEINTEENFNEWLKENEKENE